MRFDRLLLTLILGFVLTTAYSQDSTDYSSIIKGVWIAAESLQSTEIEPATTSLYAKYSFDGEGGVFIATNQFERGEYASYKIVSNILEINHSLFTILRYDNDELELQIQSIRPTLSIRRTLVRKQKYDQLWKLQGAGNLSVNPPLFKGNFHLWEYMFSRFETPDEYEAYLRQPVYEPQPTVPRDDNFIRAEVVVDSSGRVSVNDLTSSDMNPKKLERLKKKLENTSGNWIPGDVRGEYQTQSIKLVFIKRGKTSMIAKGRALKSFRKAYALYERQDYRAAAITCSEAINLDQTKFQFYLFRAACYIQLEDVDRYCSDMARANSLNRFVSLDNIEVVKGEALQIRCSSR